jgi:hypothetical protein
MATWLSDPSRAVIFQQGNPNVFVPFDVVQQFMGPGFSCCSQNVSSQTMDFIYTQYLANMETQPGI